MRKLDVSIISESVAKLLASACYELSDDVCDALENAYEKETSVTARSVLRQIIENVSVAKEDQLPLCQDTGLAVVFIDIGQDVNLTGANLEDAVWSGVRKATAEAFLRRSVLNDPLERLNTGDNTPGVLHINIVPGDKVHIFVVPKGGGSENMSRVGMLNPSDGQEGVVDFVVNTVKEAGGKPCPPLIVGVGLGGTFEKAGLLSKRALLRKVGGSSGSSKNCELESMILEKINKLGIGPMGFGGNMTALAVHIERYPCHIASMPIAVNLQCHSARHREIII